MNTHTQPTSTCAPADGITAPEPSRVAWLIERIDALTAVADMNLPDDAMDSVVDALSICRDELTDTVCRTPHELAAKARFAAACVETNDLYLTWLPRFLADLAEDWRNVTEARTFAVGLMDQAAIQ